MLLALWWYFWTLQQPGGPQIVTALGQHFIVALVIAQAFAPPSARSHALILEQANAGILGDGAVLDAVLVLPGVYAQQVRW